MYSGSTITAYSGRLLGAHQKIDRMARKHLDNMLPGNRFPGAGAILYFEGRNGPDAIKRKSPAKDEPWHYLQPFDLDDTQLIALIEHHYDELVKALREQDKVRASFEAAWLAHAIVDGLTPAHHYPYEEKLVELANGRDISERTTIFKKLILPGQSIRQAIGNNWKMWGPKGLFTTHAAFECGIAMLMAPQKCHPARLTKDKVVAFEAQTLGQWFRRVAQDIARLNLYDDFYETGWTIALARRVRNQLSPMIVQSVALVWYGAALEAGLQKA